ncbi:MAG TPA: Uma2 family endonuclease [Ktedonobacterales bacterium]|jgi:Uma2 family endonuclease
MAITKRYRMLIHEPGDLLTVAEFAQLPEDQDGWRTELIRGVVHRMPPVKDPRHDWILFNLATALGAYLKTSQLGGRASLEQVGYALTAADAPGGTAVAPDLAFVAAERLPQVQEARQRKEYVRLAPDLVAEIVSPSQATDREMEERAQMWLEAGTRLVWNIWPDEQRVDVWMPDESLRTLGGHDALDGRDVVPGFTMVVADLFA